MPVRPLSFSQRLRKQSVAEPIPQKKTYDYQWEKFRRWYFAQPENVLCLDCLEKDIVSPATEIHHIVKVEYRPDLKYVLSNLRPLDKRCHSIRTARGE